MEDQGSVNVIGSKVGRSMLDARFIQSLTGITGQSQGYLFDNIFDLNGFYAPCMAFGTLLCVAGGAVKVRLHYQMSTSIGHMPKGRGRTKEGNIGCAHCSGQMIHLIHILDLQVPLDTNLKDGIEKPLPRPLTGLGKCRLTVAEFLGQRLIRGYGSLGPDQSPGPVDLPVGRQFDYFDS